MHFKSTQIFRVYFNSWWLPAVVFLVLLAGFAATANLLLKTLAMVGVALMAAVGLALLGVLAAAIWNLVQRRWAKGLVNLLLLPVCGMTLVSVFGFIMFASMFGPSEDGFADHLKIPANVNIAEPGKEPEAAPGEKQDTFQTALLAALRAPGNGDATVTGSIAPLVQLQQTAPALLRRYLSTHPGWRVFKERGNVIATKRWMIGPEWTFTLHGYYSQSAIDTWQKSGIPDFQSRLSIGISGKPWARGPHTTWLQAGETTTAILSEGNQMQESHCVISANPLVVEVFEQSDARERRLTRATLEYLSAEMAALVAQPTWEAARNQLPVGSIQTGAPSLALQNSFQPGIYNSVIWVNPGEPGMLYLKAFELTHGTPLSVERLKEASNEWVGWSNDPRELFFSNTPFTIYEGDWGKPYAARFEVWFTPDSGVPERKLMEKIFKIEGWQR